MMGVLGDAIPEAIMALQASFVAIQGWLQLIIGINVGVHRMARQTGKLATLITWRLDQAQQLIAGSTARAA